jgi:hypothetical protein
LFHRSADRLRDYAATDGAAYGVDLAALSAWADAAADAAEADQPVDLGVRLCA